jgi:hypothetical protein
MPAHVDDYRANGSEEIDELIDCVAGLFDDRSKSSVLQIAIMPWEGDAKTFIRGMFPDVVAPTAVVNVEACLREGAKNLSRRE